MTDWKQKSWEHKRRAANLRAEAAKLTNTALSEDIAARACEINDKEEGWCPTCGRAFLRGGCRDTWHDRNPARVAMTEDWP